MSHWTDHWKAIIIDILIKEGATKEHAKGSNNQIEGLPAFKRVGFETFEGLDPRAGCALSH